MRKKILLACAMFFVVCLAASPWIFDQAGSDAPLDHELVDRGKGFLFGSNQWCRANEGSEKVCLSSRSSLYGLLFKSDDRSFAAALEQEGAEWFAIERAFLNKACAATSSLCAQLARASAFANLQAIAVSPGWVIYRPRASRVHTKDDLALLAPIARRILAGATVEENQWSASAVQPRNVEVLVVLRSNNKARLWRSARSSSIARGLMLAAGVARTRWQERKAALGGDLNELLPRLTVEVYAIESDGALRNITKDNASLFIQSGHGVGFERKGTWFYRLPELVESDRKNGARDAFGKLFEEYGYDRDSFKRKDLALFRLVMLPLSLESKPMPL